MARSFYINGESMISVKGNVNTTINAKTYLGLADGPVRVTLDFRHRDMNVDAWGGEIPADVQFMLAGANITMNLVHFDATVLATCNSEATGGLGEGVMGRAGLPLGGAVARFAAGTHYIGLNIESPVAALPWRFYYAFMTGPPFDFPLGTEKSIVTVNWRCIPYTTDPWGGGTGAQGAILYDRILDT